MSRSRSPLQRAVAARYDGTHAFLVRAVHPLCFGAFALIVGCVVGGILYVATSAGGGGEGVVEVVGGSLFVGVGLIVVAFQFVVSRGVVWVSLVVLLLTWCTLMLWTPPHVIIWVGWSAATLSVLLQIVLLMRVVPARYRAGLLHLMVPATVGTLVGAVPVAMGLIALIEGDFERALDLARLAFLAAIVVVAVLLGLHEYGHAREAVLLRAFARAHGFAIVDAEPDPKDDAKKTDTKSDATAHGAQMIDEWSTHSGPWQGQHRGRAVTISSGYTSSGAPDVPSLHLTLVTLQLEHDGRELWVRRRSRAYDNVLVNGNHSDVQHFESIALDEGWAVRFGAGTTQLEAFQTMTPLLLDALGRRLDAAQICRIGTTMHGWIVGGVLSVEELENLVLTLHDVARLLERAERRSGG